MKTLSKLALLALAIIFVSVARTYGASGNLEGPSVALPASLTQADRDKIHAALQRKDCKFVSGSFLTKDSQLHYMSDTESLGKFLEELTKCPGVRIHIGFYKPGPNAMWAVDGSNWSVFHSATDNSFSVKIRLGSDIDLTRLYVPPLASTTDMDGKTGLTRMYHVIPISKYLKSSPATTPSALSEAKTREKLETLIPEAIRILEAKEYATFLKDFLSPADFKAISQNTGLDEKEFAKQFGDKRAPQLLAILRAISDAKPTLDSTGTIATYELKEEIYAKKKFSFQKIDKYWYMLNKPK